MAHELRRPVAFAEVKPPIEAAWAARFGGRAWPAVGGAELRRAVDGMDPDMTVDPGSSSSEGREGSPGRAVLAEFSLDWEIRSSTAIRHRTKPAPTSKWVRADASADVDWGPLLADVDLVINLAWYRQAPARRFRALADGLIRLIEASGRPTSRGGSS